MKKQIATIKLTNDSNVTYEAEYEIVAEAEAGIYIDLKSKRENWYPHDYLFIPNSQIVTRKEV